MAEYLDRCLGQHAVVDVLQEQDTVYYVFDDGHALPLLCCCCGEPLVFQDIAKTRQDMRGRRLEGMSSGEAVLDNGQTVIEFTLEFSAKGLLGQGTAITTALKSAAQLRHPADCRHRGALPKAAHSHHKPH